LSLVVENFLFRESLDEISSDPRKDRRMAYKLKKKKKRKQKKGKENELTTKSEW